MESPYEISYQCSNWHPISFRFGVISAYCLNFGHFAFWATFWRLRDSTSVHLGLIGKRVAQSHRCMVQVKQPEAKSVPVYCSWGVPNCQLPDPIQDIKRLESIRVLGVIINDQLTTSDHVTELIATCARTLYAIWTLKARGLVGNALHTVFKASTTVQGRLLYCAAAWSPCCQSRPTGIVSAAMQAPVFLWRWYQDTCGTIPACRWDTVWTRAEG